MGDSLLLPSRCSRVPLPTESDSFCAHYSDETVRVTRSVKRVRMEPGHLGPPRATWGPHGASLPACSSCSAGGSPPPVSCSTPEPRDSPYISTAARGHKGGTAARNPSLWHVKSKLWFSRRARTKPSFCGESQGLGSVPRGGMKCIGATEASSSPQLGWVGLWQPHRVLFRSLTATPMAQGPPCLTCPPSKMAQREGSCLKATGPS